MGRTMGVCEWKTHFLSAEPISICNLYAAATTDYRDFVGSRHTIRRETQRRETWPCRKLSSTYSPRKDRTPL